MALAQHAGGWLVLGAFAVVLVAREARNWFLTPRERLLESRNAGPEPGAHAEQPEHVTGA